MFGFFLHACFIPLGNNVAKCLLSSGMKIGDQFFEGREGANDYWRRYF